MARFARLVVLSYPHHITLRGVRFMASFLTISLKQLANPLSLHPQIKITEGIRGYLFQGRFGSCFLDRQYLLATGRRVELTLLSRVNYLVRFDDN